MKNVRHRDHEEEFDLLVTGVVPAAAQAWAICTIPLLIAWLYLSVAGHEIWSWLALATAAIFAVFAVVSFVGSFLRHRGMTIRVTTLAVVRCRKRLFSEHEETIPLGAVETVHVDRSLLGFLTKSGSLVIHAGGRTIVWRDVRRPHDVRNEILSHMSHEHIDT
jgi:hypothetical protein